MKQYSYSILSIFLLLTGMVVGKEKALNTDQPVSVGNNGSEYLLSESEQTQVPQQREQIILFFEDFENDTTNALWETDGGWGLTETDYWSPTHSFNSPNDESTQDNTWSLLSPVYTLPEIGQDDLPILQDSYKN